MIYTETLRKKETAPDGSVDQNVFDIMQGVSINLFIKTGNKKSSELGQVFHYDLFGRRDYKYEFLSSNSLKSINFKNLKIVAPDYFLVQKNFQSKSLYDKGIYIPSLFPINSLGIQTHRDNLAINTLKKDLISRINLFFNKETEDRIIKSKFDLKENSEWKISVQRKGFFNQNNITEISYRPFDNRFIYYDSQIVDRLRDRVSKHIKNKNNLCLVVPRQCTSDWRYAFISKYLIESNLTGTAGRFGSGNFFPLYLYTHKDLELQNEKVPNLDTEIVSQISARIGLHFSADKPDYDVQTEEINQYYPEDILDYVYAVLHSPKYRETYKEFLKIDFPRIPYPTNQKSFWELVDLGKQIRDLHLLESEKVNDFISSYPEDGSNVVNKPSYKNGSVYINDTQYFANVPEIAWNFYIGGYQPAQKWLKDRKDMELSYDDIVHYNKMIVALTETDRLMKEIDNIIIIK